MPLSGRPARCSHRFMKTATLRRLTPVQNDGAEREPEEHRHDRRSLTDRRRFTRRDRRGSRNLAAVASDEPMAIAGRKHDGDT